jgi:hypothetical protein
LKRCLINGCVFYGLPVGRQYFFIKFLF